MESVVNSPLGVIDTRARFDAGAGPMGGFIVGPCGRADGANTVKFSKKFFCV